MTDRQIRTRPDGSIDTDFYIRRGRHMRSEAAHEMFAQAPRSGRTARPARMTGWFGNPFRRPTLG